MDGVKFLKSLEISRYLRLPDNCSVLLTEVSAIQAAVKTIGDMCVLAAYITMLSNYQAVIRALEL